MSIKKGETVLTAAQIVVKIKKEFVKTNCSYCLSPGAAVKCPSCSYLFYCSDMCILNHNHAFECSEAL